MDALLESIANNPDSPILLVLLIIALALCGALGHFADGRQKNAILRAKVKSLTSENDRMATMLDSRTADPLAGTDIEKLAREARIAGDERAELRETLSAVLTADRSYPQLPQHLRDQIEQILSRPNRKA